ncbi:hypothetical protein D3C86_1534350 [compost metagenome]
MLPPGNVTLIVLEQEAGDGSDPIRLFAEAIGPTAVTSGSMVIGYTFEGSLSCAESHKISNKFPFRLYGLIQEDLLSEASWHLALLNLISASPV